MACIALLQAACGDSGTTATRAPVVSIRITLSSPDIVVGHSVQLIATPLDAAGAALTGRTVTWSVPTGALVSISANGTLTGAAPGVDTVFALSEGIVQPLVVSVAPMLVTVSPPSLTLAWGTSATLTLGTRNLFGELLVGTPVWTTTTPSIVSVSSTGRVTGLAPGNGVVTGHIGLAEATVAVEVRADTLEVTTELVTDGGNFGALIVRPSGRLIAVGLGTVTLRSLGPVVIEGSVTSNVAGCAVMSIESRSTVTINGSIDISCGLRIVALGGMQLNGATIRTGRGQTYTNDTTLTALGLGTVASSTTPLACEFNASTMTVNPPTNAAGQSWSAQCRGDITFTGPTRIQAQDGANGAETLNGAGVVFVRSTRDIIGRGGDVVLASGNGGNGTDVVVNAAYPVLAFAAGGKGGNVGAPGAPPFRLQAARNIVVPAPSTGSFTLQVGNGGRGGAANATGDDGSNATELTWASTGGDAHAKGGPGGDVLALSIIAGAGILGGALQVTGGNGGNGGDAEATGGKGGNGNARFVDGAKGGRFIAFGGDGGMTAVQSTGSGVSRAGNGGKASLFGSGGGNGFGVCGLPNTPIGGRGGNGGLGQANPGFGGTVASGIGAAVGVNGQSLLNNAGNGGNGGNGVIAGTAGQPGEDIPSITVNSRVVLGRIFSAGLAGMTCP